MLKKISSLFLFLYISCTAFAQSGGMSPLDAESLMQEQMMNSMMDDKLQSESYAVGNIVEPEHYYVGPGDVLSIQNLANSTKQELIVITPENSVYIPRIATISVKGMTLAEVRDSIIAKIQERIPHASAFVSLYKPRMVLVTLKGDVLMPDTYTFPASYKVSTVIKAASKVNDNTRISMQRVPGLMKYIEKDKRSGREYGTSGLSPDKIYSTRNIIIKHQNSDYEVCDLEKAYAFKDLSNDPYVRECDEIVVPFEPKDYPVISISGEVINPGVLYYKEGDNASFLLKYATGLTDKADKDNVFLFKPSAGKIKLVLNEIMELQGQDYELEPGSMIIIGKRNTDKSYSHGVVAVNGEINNEGTYFIQNNVTKLSEIVDLAGGFTDNAYLPLAYIVRRDKNQYNLDNARDLMIEDFKYSDLTMEDTARYFYLKEYQRPEVSCDFVALFDKNEKEFDVTLQDGDVIVIPECPKSIFVFGRVTRPGYVPFVEGQNMDWYVNKAGGYTQDAEDSRARIIRGKNKVWVEGDEEVLVYAGDQIYVPREPDIPPTLEIQTYAAYAGIAGAAAGLLNVIYYIFFAN